MIAMRETDRALNPPGSVAGGQRRRGQTGQHRRGEPIRFLLQTIRGRSDVDIPARGDDRAVLLERVRRFMRQQAKTRRMPRGILS